MSIDLTAKYRAIHSLEARSCREAAEGKLPAAIMPMIPRNPRDITPEAEALGLTTQPSGIWCTTLADPDSGTKGGSTHRATVSRACEMVIFKPHSVRFATPEEITSQLALEQSRLDERIGAGRNLSRKEDAKYGKRD